MMHDKFAARYALRNLPYDGEYPPDNPVLRRDGNAERYIVIETGDKFPLDEASHWLADGWPLRLNQVARDIESAIQGGLDEC